MPMTLRSTVLRYRDQFRVNRGPERAAFYLKAAQRSNDLQLLQEAAAEICDYLAFISTLPENFDVEETNPAPNNPIRRN